MQSEGLSAGEAETGRRRGHRPLVWYAGWADKIAQVVGNANPVAGPYFNLSTPEPTGVVGGARAAGVLAARPGQRGRPGDRHRQHRGGRVVVEPAAAGGHAGRGAGHLRPARRRGQHPDRLGGRVGPWLAAHMDVNAIDLTGVAGDADAGDRPGGGRGRQPQAGAPRARRPSRTGRVDPGPRRDDRVPGDQDGLAPHGGLTLRCALG